MGDRTSFQVTIVNIPKGKAKAVATLFNEYGLQAEWGSPTGWEPADLRDRIEGNESPTACDDELSCGHGEYIAARLIELCVTFYCWEDPKYEWMGTLHYNHPKLGVFEAVCDASGEVIVEAYVLTEIIKSDKSDTEIVDTLKENLGLKYQREWAILAKADAVLASIKEDDDGC